MSAPFTARRAVELVVEDVERMAAMIRASGMPVTQAHYEHLLTSRLAQLKPGDLPPDALGYFAEQSLTDELAQAHARAKRGHGADAPPPEDV